MAEKKQKGPTLADVTAQIDARLAEITTTANKTGYLGLPSGAVENVTGAYMDTPTPLPTDPKRSAPIYRDGAQDIPILSNWNKNKITKLQERMVAAGVLDDDYLEGYWDKPSRDAFEMILGDSNLMGEPDFEKVIDIRINSAPMEIDPVTGKARRRVGKDKNKRQPLSMTLSNSDDLVATAQTIAQKRIGRTFNQDELQRFVSSYHATERGAQQAQYAQTAEGAAGGTVMAPPDATTAASTFAEQTDPLAAQARNMLPMVEKINELLNVEDTVDPLQGGF